MVLESVLWLGLWVFVAYCLGSIPSAVWIGRLVKGVDVREHGSKNAGATNTMRVLGVGVGIPVLLIDIAKGYGAVSLSYLTDSFEVGSNGMVGYQIGLAVAAVLGHMFPLFAGFRGGKGVATAVGILLALSWQATLIGMGVFLVVLFISRYVSVSSMLMGVSFPLSICLLFGGESCMALKVFSVCVCVLLFISHRSNIKRLLKGEEGKATFLFGDKKK